MIGEVLDSLSPVKILLSEIIVRLKLKQKPFEMYPAASDDEIRTLWESLLEIDHTLSYDEKITKASFKSDSSYSEIKKFIAHCCHARHYSFCVKKMWQI